MTKGGNQAKWKQTNPNETFYKIKDLYTLQKCQCPKTQKKLRSCSRKEN